MEMFGLIGGLAGAGASLAGGIMNAEAQDETNQLNWAINVMNMQQRERERQEAIAMALKVRAEQKLGTTDIRGTRTHFVPGKGWVVEGGKGVLDMIALQDAEQRKVLQEDLPMRRKVMQRNYARGIEEESLADTFRRQLQNTYTPSDEGIASDLYNAQAMGIREASGDAGRRVFTQAMRTGNNSNFDDLAASMARENTQGTLPAGQSGLLSAGNAATGMFAKQGGTLDYTQPNMGYGNAIAGAGAQLASAFRGMGARGGGGVSGFGGSGGGDDSELYTGGEGSFYS